MSPDSVRLQQNLNYSKVEFVWSFFEETSVWKLHFDFVWPLADLLSTFKHNYQNWVWVRHSNFPRVKKKLYTENIEVIIQCDKGNPLSLMWQIFCPSIKLNLNVVKYWSFQASHNKAVFYSLPSCNFVEIYKG